MLRTIHLYGSLADTYGAQPIPLAVDNLQQLLCGLYRRFKGMRQFVAKQPDFIIVLTDAGKANPEAITPETAVNFGNRTDIHLVPNHAGAGIEVAAFFGLAAGSFAAIAVNVVANLLISMAIGAIAQALAPSPTATSAERTAENPSFLFNGPENVVEQGYPVPLVFGAFTTGSVVISASTTVEQLPFEPEEEDPPANGGGDPQPSFPAAFEWQWGG